MAILSAPDLALLRAEAGAIIKVTDALLSDNVCSYRLNRSPIRRAAWGFEQRNSWKNRFLAGGIEILDKAEFPFMCRTDISKYYPSIQIDLLQQALLTNGCDARAVARIFAILKFWQDFCRLDGLPIGPEASAVFSNFFLRPIDSLIATTGAQYKRYGDDMLIFSRNRSMGEAVAESLDDELRFLQLTRSIEKTEFFDDPADARANLQDAEIDYMEGATNYYPDLGLYTVKRAFRRILQTAPKDLRVSRLRWVLKYLTNHYERDGCLEISQRTDLMNIDPKIATNYLAVAKSDQRVTGELHAALGAAARRTVRRSYASPTAPDVPGEDRQGGSQGVRANCLRSIHALADAELGMGGPGSRRWNQSVPSHGSGQRRGRTEYSQGDCRHVKAPFASSAVQEIFAR